MNLRKYMGWLIGGGVALVLVLALLVLVFRSRGQYVRVDESLQQVSVRQAGLIRRDPFPSPENVERAQRNQRLLQDYFQKLYNGFRQDQIMPVQLEPAQFPYLLEETIRSLSGRAQASKVKLPDKFSFGFEQYAQGALPVATNIPRLVVQIKTIEQLCGILFDNKISELVAVEREVFEQAAESPAATEAAEPDRRRARREAMDGGMAPSATPAAGHFTSSILLRERVQLTFSASDLAMRDVLNALAASKLFAVVSKAELVNEKFAAIAAGVTPAAPAVAGAGVPGSTNLSVRVNRDERIAAGRELVKAVLTVDAYRFTANETTEAKP